MQIELVEWIDEVVLEVKGCSQEAITISYKEIASEEREGKVIKAEIEPNKDKMMVDAGKELLSRLIQIL